LVSLEKLTYERVARFMEVVTPSWFKQRQAKAEPAGANTYRLFGPNLPECFLSIRRGPNGKWYGALRYEADGPDVAVTDAVFERDYEAWEAAFELYRVQVIV
jgi:hypothetical protein